MKAHTLFLAVLALLLCGPIYSQQHKRQVPERRGAVSLITQTHPLTLQSKSCRRFFMEQIQKLFTGRLKPGKNAQRKMSLRPLRTIANEYDATWLPLS